MGIIGLVAMNMNAQEGGFGVKGGLNFNSFSGDEAEGTKSNIGYHIGATYEMPLVSIVNLETGLFLDTRGAKAEEGDGKINLTGLTLPILAKVNVEVAPVNVYFMAGPFLNYNFSGKLKAGDRSRDIEFGSEREKMKAFGAGLNFGAGVAYNKVSLTLGYDLGLTQFDNDDDSSSKLNAFKISLGYKF